MIDEITTQYVAMQQARTEEAANMAVLKSSIDTVTRQGDNVEGLIQSAGAVNMNATDAQVSQALALTDPSKGQLIDLTI